jgi:hypothetical protein
MNLRGFEQDFTGDLELFVSGNAEHIIPYTIWAPRKTAAPERHHALGSAASISIQTQIHLLDTQNPSFEIIESLLRLYMNPVEYSMLSGTIDEEKEQVWLFAIRWLTHYYECLTEPLAIRTEFYRQSHNKFLNLMRMMLQYSPGRRISFVEALRSWYPDSPVLEPRGPKDQSKDQELPQESVSPQCPELQVCTVVAAGSLGSSSSLTPESLGEYPQESQTRAVEPTRTTAQTPAKKTETEPEKSSLPATAESYPDAHPPLQPSGPVVSVAVSVSAPNGTSVLPSAPVATLVRSRLVLKRSVYPSERNKTRKSPRN